MCLNSFSSKNSEHRECSQCNLSLGDLTRTLCCEEAHCWPSLWTEVHCHPYCYQESCCETPQGLDGRVLQGSSRVSPLESLTSPTPLFHLLGHPFCFLISLREALSHHGILRPNPQGSGPLSTEVAREESGPKTPHSCLS